MASVKIDCPVVAEGKVELVAGSVVKGGTATGKGFTVSVASSHTYSIVFDHRYTRVIAFVPGIQLASVADFHAMANSFTAGTKTLVAQTVAVATPTALTAAGDKIHFLAVMERA